VIAPWVSLEAPRDTGPARIGAEKRQMSSQGVSGSSAAVIALSSSSGVGEKAQRHHNNVVAKASPSGRATAASAAL